MCGIYGYTQGEDPGFNGPRFLAGALGGQTHRGPDGSGIYLGNTAGVGMVRLRIRAAEAEPEPIPLPDAAYAAYNGEIYLGGSGVVPDGGAYEVSSLLSPNADGMFALLKLGRDDEIEIRRDAYGIKPLFVREHRGGLAFASEKTPLIQHLGKVRLRREAIEQYIAFGRPIDGLGYYEGIHPIPPGGVFAARDGNMTQVDRLNIGQRIADAAGGPSPSYGEVRAAVRAAIQSTLVSNRKVGIAVSGGLDSSILCSELDALGIPDMELISVKSMGSEDGIDDLGELELRGQAWKTWRLTSCHFDPATYCRDLRRAIAIIGEPTQMTSAPLYLRLAEKAAEAGVVVLLLGEGADELFCGYRSYLPMLKNWSLRDFLYRPQERTVCRRLLSDAAREQCVGALDSFMDALPGADEWTRLRASELIHNLEPLLLRADHTLMHCSIEGRTPFLHGDVADLAFRIPIGALLSETQTKVFLRQAFAEDLPTRFSAEIKKPFRAPVAGWFAGPLSGWLAAEIARGTGVYECLGLTRDGLEHVLTTTLKGDTGMAKIAYCLLTLIMWIDWLVESDFLEEPDILRAYRPPTSGGLDVFR